MKKFKNKKFASALLAMTTLLGSKHAPKTAAAGNTMSSTTSNAALKSVEYYKSAMKKSLIALGVCAVLLPASIIITNKVGDYLEKKETERKESERKIEREKSQKSFSNLGKEVATSLFDHYSKEFDEEMNKQRIKKFAEEHKMKEKQAAEAEQKEYQGNYNKFVKSKFDESFKNNQHKKLHDLLSKVFQNEWNDICKKVVFVKRPLPKRTENAYMEIKYKDGKVAEKKYNMDIENYKNKIIKNNQNKEDVNAKIDKEIKDYKDDLETNDNYWVLEHNGFGTYLSGLSSSLYNSFKFMFEQKWVDEELKAFQVTDNSIGYSLSIKQVTDKVEFLKDEKILRFTISNSVLNDTNVDLTFDLDVSEYLSP